MPKLELDVSEGFCATFKDPRDTGVGHAETYLPFYEINKLKRGNANVRPPEEKRRPYQAMLKSVEKTPNEFHLKNRGITYICTDLNLDRDRKILTITIPSDNELKGKRGDVLRCGIADGGHTFDLITKTVAEEKAYEHIEGWKIPFARVHFIATKDLANVEPIVEALNTSTQVKEMSLHEYQNRFQGLKRALDESGFPLEIVATTENENKEWDIFEVIQRMSTFLPERWHGHQPVQSYKSKNKAVKLYLDDETRHEFEEIYPVIRDVITLPEYIESQFSDLFLNGKESLQKGVRNLKKPKNRPGTSYTTHHKFNAAITMPLAAAFRVLLNKRGDTYEWATDYKAIFRDCSEDLYRLFTNRASKAAQISQIASDPTYWASAMDIVNKAKDEALGSGPIVRKKTTKVTGEDRSETQVDDRQEEMDTEK
jgi:hypothetical protein